ncbi:MAG: UbiX family flavin prenyltransferase [Actinomycetia bacterium]|nr:UbiX family flavin prenyltransferase [Actinomycetes bacterium]
MTTRRIIVGISGASGTAYGVRALELMKVIDDVETHLVVTPAARQTLAIETDLTGPELEALADEVHEVRDLAAPIASGSFPAAGMIVAPCSIKSLSAIAHSFSADLLARSADVTLKERRPLVLMVRETPFHLGHLRLMAQATEMGAIVHPPIPAFYTRPATVEEIIDDSIGRAIEHLGIEVSGIRRWEGPPAG